MSDIHHTYICSYIMYSIVGTLGRYLLDIPSSYFVGSRENPADSSLDSAAIDT